MDELVQPKAIRMRWDEGVARNLVEIAGTTTSAFAKGSPLNFWFRLDFIDLWWIGLFGRDDEFRKAVLHMERDRE